MLKKKFGPIFIEILPKKLSISSQNLIWVWDPGSDPPESGIRKKPIPDPGSRGQKSTGSGIPIRNTEPQYRIRHHSTWVRLLQIKFRGNAGAFAGFGISSFDI